MKKLKKMKTLEQKKWTLKYATGIAIIDTERYNLLKSFNNLVSVVNNGSAKELFPGLLLKFTMECSKHFDNEQKYMEETSFPNYKDHQILHNSFMYELELYNIECISGFSIDAYKVTEFIGHWWQTHIKNEDTYFVEQQFKQEEQALLYEHEIA